MAERRSLANLRARREELVRIMEQSRSGVSVSLRAAATQLPDLAATQKWIGAHPALSMIGAFAGGMLAPALVAPAVARQSSWWMELLAPIVQDSLQTAMAHFAGLPTPPPAGPRRSHECPEDRDPRR